MNNVEEELQKEEENNRHARMNIHLCVILFEIDLLK